MWRWYQDLNLKIVDHDLMLSRMRLSAERYMAIVDLSQHGVHHHNKYSVGVGHVLRNMFQDDD
jgi:hypothetical protein